MISYLTRKENIILSAIEIIDELGLHELSIREIAKRQQVSDASLYRACSASPSNFKNMNFPQY